MIGIIILVAVFLVLGFLYAWIAGIVAKEEVELKTGVLILFLAAILTVVLQVALLSLDPAVQIVLTSVGQLVAIAGLTRVMTGIALGKSFVIAIIYSVILSIVAVAFRAMAG